MKRSKILGVGSYLPSQIWKNSDLEKMMDTSDEWIQQRPISWSWIGFHDG